MWYLQSVFIPIHFFDFQWWKHIMFFDSPKSQNQKWQLSLQMRAMNSEKYYNYTNAIQVIVHRVNAGSIVPIVVA